MATLRHDPLNTRREPMQPMFVGLIAHALIAITVVLVFWGAG